MLAAGERASLNISVLRLMMTLSTLAFSALNAAMAARPFESALYQYKPDENYQFQPYEYGYGPQKRKIEEVLESPVTKVAAVQKQVRSLQVANSWTFVQKMDKIFSPMFRANHP